MKHINQFITEYIIKKKLDKPIDSEYKYHPQTKEELIKNIKELLYKEETDLNCINTSAITDMANLFRILNVSTNINVSKWNVSNVTNMYNMFYNCEDFNCDLSNWDVSKVINMTNMFYDCKKFEGKGLENWDVSKVEIMESMFFGCKNFNCNLYNWDVSNVKYMNYMFGRCNNFSQL